MTRLISSKAKDEIIITGIGSDELFLCLMEEIGKTIDFFEKVKGFDQRRKKQVNS